MNRNRSTRPSPAQVRAVLAGNIGGACECCGATGAFLSLPFPETLVKPGEAAAVQVLPTYEIKLVGLWTCVSDWSTRQPSTSGAHAVQIETMLSDSSYINSDGTRVTKEKRLLESVLPLAAAMFPLPRDPAMPKDPSIDPKAIHPAVLMDLLDGEGWLPAGVPLTLRVRNSGTEPLVFRATMPCSYMPY